MAGVAEPVVKEPLEVVGVEKVEEGKGKMIWSVVSHQPLSRWGEQARQP